jgi:hypothetical protein
MIVGMMMYSMNSEFVRSLDNEIVGLIRGEEENINDSQFNDLALRLFGFQYHTNEAYQKNCQKHGIKPNDISYWEEIPAVPADVFKYKTLTCFPVEKTVKSFISSGTSDPEKRGKLYLDKRSYEIYIESMVKTFGKYTMPDREKIRIISLSPPPEMVPEIAMVHAIGLWMKEYGTSDSTYLVGKEGMDIKSLIGALKQAEKTGEPVFMIGASFNYVQLLDAFEKQGLSFNLPEGSRTIDGGGYKGRSKEVSKKEFYSMLPKVFGLREDHCVNLLGMTEDATNYYDNVLRNKVTGRSEPRFKPNHPWTRTVAVHPETLERLSKGEVGLLRHYDLANVGSVMVLQTDDLGFEIESGFEITGRAKGATARGCSIGAEEWIKS